MRFAVIGDPISHSLSPKMHSAAYAALGLDHTYEAVKVPLDQVDSELDRLAREGFAGVNVTVPLKEAAYRWCLPDDFAARAQATNTIRFSDRAGVNTDGSGMVNVVLGLPQHDTQNVLLLGAGGSSRAIALALHESGNRVVVWNRTHQRARDLATLTGSESEEDPNIADFNVVINATSASMSGQLPEVVREQLPIINRNDSTAIDLYYSNEPTVFQSTFKNMGWRTLDGRELLVAQGALAFEFWLGIAAPVEAMRASIGL